MDPNISAALGSLITAFGLMIVRYVEKRLMKKDYQKKVNNAYWKGRGEVMEELGQE